MDGPTQRARCRVACTTKKNNQSTRNPCLCTAYSHCTRARRGREGRKGLKIVVHVEHLSRLYPGGYGGKKHDLSLVIFGRKTLLRSQRQLYRGNGGMAAAAIMAAQPQPSWSQNYGHHGHATTAIMVTEPRPSWRQNHGHHGHRTTAIMAAELRSSWPQNHGHHGHRTAAIMATGPRSS